jgi:cysteinyl-tRNA synthetase
VPIRTLAEIAADLSAGKTADIGWEAAPRDVAGDTGVRTPAAPPVTSLRDEMARLEGTFIAALGHGDSRAAAAALIELDDTIEARIRAGEDSPDLDDATSTFRALIVRLAEAAGQGGDPRALIEPYVDTLVTLRGRARDAGDWASADLIRDRLTAAGVEVRDGAAGSEWVLGGASEPGGPAAR